MHVPLIRSHASGYAYGAADPSDAIETLDEHSVSNGGALDGCRAAAFEELYRRADDPWQFATSVYERFRYLVTMRALLRSRYDSAFEPGCSVGELTALLAQRCARVRASDIAAKAVQLARRRCSTYANVEIECADVAGEIPEGPFDLIVLSEIGYYFRAPDLRRLADRLLTCLADGGEFVAVHWLGHSADHLLHGDEVHCILAEQLALHWVRGERHRDFRLDSWIRTQPK